MNVISQWLAGKLIKYAPDREGIESALFYGIDAAIYTFSSTAGLILIGWAMRMPLQALCIIAVFYLNQTTGGGYHAKSHLRCFLMMSTALILSLGALWLIPPGALLLAAAIASIVVLICHPIVLHPNRAHLRDRIPAFARRFRILMVLETALYAALLALKSPATPAFSVALALSAISRIAAKRAYAKVGN